VAAVLARRAESAVSSIIICSAMTQKSKAVRLTRRKPNMVSEIANIVLQIVFHGIDYSGL